MSSFLHSIVQWYPFCQNSFDCLICYFVLFGKNSIFNVFYDSTDDSNWYDDSNNNDERLLKKKGQKDQRLTDLINA